MKTTKFALIACAFVLVLGTLSSAVAAEDQPSWLFVQTAADFTSDGDSLTIPYEREIFAFTDRPNRQHAHLNAQEFTALWGGGDDDFSQDPPNAVLTWVSDGEVQEAEIELMAVWADDMGRAITYQIQFEEGTPLPAQAEHVSLFVDDSGLATQDLFYLRKVMR